MEKIRSIPLLVIPILLIFASFFASRLFVIYGGGISRTISSNSTQNLLVNWQVHLSQNVDEINVVNNQIVLLYYESGDISAYDMEKGIEIWEFNNRFSRLNSQVFGVSKDIVVTSLGGQQIIGLDSKTGQTLWEYDLSESPNRPSIQISDKKVVHIGQFGNQTVANGLDLLSGESVWGKSNLPSRSFIGANRCDGYQNSEQNIDHALCLFFQNQIIILDMDSGRIQDDFNIDYRITNETVILGKYAFVPFVLESDPLLILDIEGNNIFQSLNNCEGSSLPRFISKSNFSVQVITSCGEIFHSSIQDDILKVTKVFESEDIFSDLVYDGKIGYFVTQSGAITEIDLLDQSITGEVKTESRVDITNTSIMALTEKSLITVIDGKNLIVFNRNSH